MLEEVIQIINDKGEARNPLHQRRMELLRVKKTGPHSDHLYTLEQYASLIDFPSLTNEALISHLFLESVDVEMAKVATDNLPKQPGGDLSTLRCEVKRVESTVWYN